MANINAIIKSAHARANTPSVDDGINESRAVVRRRRRQRWMEIKKWNGSVSKWKSQCVKWLWVYVDLSVWYNDLMCSHHLFAFTRLDEFVCCFFASATIIFCFFLSFFYICSHPFISSVVVPTNSSSSSILCVVCAPHRFLE